MSRRLFWTDAQDTQIRRRRCEGATWETIAAELCLGLRAVRERALRIGVARDQADVAPPPEDPFREPLPAGHPTSWNAINAGTVLQGQPYPLRVFRR